jgi:hypothetical protein
MNYFLFTPDPTGLRKFAIPSYSQWGEDGLIRYVLNHLPVTDKWCVEFGAWDGIHLSNTYDLVKNAGYNAVFIEGNSLKFESLQENMASYPNVLTIFKFVEVEGNNTLDNILMQTPITKNLDLLSIDIDGNDYHIWKSLQFYSPKVVVIEIKQTEKPGVIKINNKNSETSWTEGGTSISSMTSLANEKGYRLLAAFGFNAFYIKQEFYGLFFDRDYSIEDIFPYDMLPASSLIWSEKLRHWELLFKYSSGSELIQRLMTKLHSFFARISPNPKSSI